MTLYTVNATVSFVAWLDVEADSPEDAIEQAHEAGADEFEYDSGTASVEFNVTPEYEVEA